MRKRRVGVTARLRQTVGNQGTGSLQVVSEMAAPLELRTPMGTAAEAAECGWKCGDQGAGVNWQRPSEIDITGSGDGARNARMRRCLILRQGASPLRPPAPFPFRLIMGKAENLSRVRKPRKRRAPLTDSLPSQEVYWDKGKGAFGKQGQHTASRWSASKSFDYV